MLKEHEGQWFLLYCKYCKDSQVESILKESGYEVYRPLKVNQSTSDNVTTSLFPRYIFIKKHAANFDFTKISYTRGVQKFVGFGSGHIAVADRLIEQIRSSEKLFFEASGEECEFKYNQSVSLSVPYFSAMEAIYKEDVGSNRCMLLIKILDKERMVCVRRENIARKQI